MDYITIASTGDATDFGNLLAAAKGVGGVSSNIRAVFAGGDTGSYQNVMQHVTIASTGNASDFGDLTGTAAFPGGTCSRNHGGLQ